MQARGPWSARPCLQFWKDMKKGAQQRLLCPLADRQQSGLVLCLCVVGPPAELAVLLLVWDLPCGCQRRAAVTMVLATALMPGPVLLTRYRRSGSSTSLLS